MKKYLFIGFVILIAVKCSAQKQTYKDGPRQRADTSYSGLVWYTNVDDTLKCRYVHANKSDTIIVLFTWGMGDSCGKCVVWKREFVKAWNGKGPFICKEPYKLYFID